VTWTNGISSGQADTDVFVFSPSTQTYLGSGAGPKQGEFEVAVFLPRGKCSGNELCKRSSSWYLRVKSKNDSNFGVQVGATFRAGAAGVLGMLWLALVVTGTLPLGWAAAGLLFFSLSGVMALTIPSASTGNWEVVAATAPSPSSLGWSSATTARLEIKQNGNFTITPTSWLGVASKLGSFTGSVTTVAGGVVPLWLTQLPEMTLNGVNSSDKFVGTSTTILGDTVTGIFPLSDGQIPGDFMMPGGPRNFCFNTSSGLKAIRFSEKAPKGCSGSMTKHVRVSDGCTSSTTGKDYGSGEAGTGCPVMSGVVRSQFSWYLRFVLPVAVMISALMQE